MITAVPDIQKGGVFSWLCDVFWDAIEEATIPEENVLTISFHIPLTVKLYHSSVSGPPERNAKSRHPETL